MLFNRTVRYDPKVPNSLLRSVDLLQASWLLYNNKPTSLPKGRNRFREEMVASSNFAHGRKQTRGMMSG